MHFKVESKLGIFKIGPDPDGLGLIVIRSCTDQTQVQFQYDDLEDIIAALARLQAYGFQGGS